MRTDIGAMVNAKTLTTIAVDVKEETVIVSIKAGAPEPKATCLCEIKEEGNNNEPQCLLALSWFKQR